MVQMWSEIMEHPQVLERCLNKNSNILREIVRVIRSRNIDSICIAARGTSDHAAIYGKYVIELTTGIPVALAASSIFTIYNRSLSLKNSLVIGISQSGKAADVIEVLKGANTQGALTVGITNFPDSPLAQESSYHLCCEAGLEKSVAATKTFAAQMYLLALLAAEWSGDSSMLGELSVLPDKIPQVYSISDIIKEKVCRYRFMNECFVLSRGVNYPIALEAALKIQETTYARAKAFATSDFQHGPIAMVERDIPVLIFAPEGPSFRDTAEMANKLKQNEIELIVVSNNREILEIGECSFAIPQMDNDIISPFYNVTVAQMFACQLALVKGLNPDNPRGLSKVTITR